MDSHGRVALIPVFRSYSLTADTLTHPNPPQRFRKLRARPPTPKRILFATRLDEIATYAPAGWDPGSSVSFLVSSVQLGAVFAERDVSRWNRSRVNEGHSSNLPNMINFYRMLQYSWRQRSEGIPRE